MYHRTTHEAWGLYTPGLVSRTTHDTWPSITPIPIVRSITLGQLISHLSWVVQHSHPPWVMDRTERCTAMCGP